MARATSAKLTNKRISSQATRHRRASMSVSPWRRGDRQRSIRKSIKRRLRLKRTNASKRRRRDGAGSVWTLEAAGGSSRWTAVRARRLSGRHKRSRSSENRACGIIGRGVDGTAVDMNPADDGFFSSPSRTSRRGAGRQKRVGRADGDVRQRAAFLLSLAASLKRRLKKLYQWTLEGAQATQKNSERLLGRALAMTL